MNSILKRVIDDNGDKWNKEITDGLAKKIVKEIPSYLDTVFNMAINNSNNKLVYNGMRRLTVDEELYLYKKGTKDIDTAYTDVVKYKLLLEYDGEEVDYVNIPIPFAGDAGVFRLSGTKYQIIPVLTDTVISPSNNGIFIRLLVDKLNFYSEPMSLYKNDILTNVNIVHSPSLLNSKKIKDKPLGNVIAPLILYLLGKNGLRRSLEDYDNKMIYIVPETELDKYDKDKYTIIKSTGKKPVGLTDNNYIHHGYGIVIDNDNINSYTLNLSYSLMYIFNVLPKYVKPLIKVIESNDIETEIIYWYNILGMLGYRGGLDKSLAINEINDRFNTLETYIDLITKRRLEEVSSNIEDVFDLFKLVIEHYDEWRLSGIKFKDTKNRYYRYYDILYYLMYDYIVGINRLMAEINKYSNDRNSQLNPLSIKKKFDRHLSSRIIFKLNSNGSNISIMFFNTVNDTKFPKVTSRVELQMRGTGVKSDSNNKFPYEVRNIEGIDMVTSSILMLKKDSPTPKLNFNPNVRLYENGRVNLTEEDIKYVTEFDYLIKEKMAKEEFEKYDLGQEVNIDDDDQ